ncbi:MAG: Unknown protein [uncultured Thiotrichaceae bacterium]|uniref:Uncharacterized protein n=1 Tax=uncultured Thiotrichaceae bacterium TaxID=298394 RepID=A0A6S6TUJ1_9GAMM|nr:MAG: Unknown protein [uncultured Thiotrichaceae bacterium]
MGLTSGKIHVVINDAPILEFDRSKPVPGQQRRYLDNMDSRMENGIQLNGDFIATPDASQRSQFVASSMVNALFAENYSLAIAMCTWLAERIPDLKQVQVIGDVEGEMRINLVFDRDYITSQTEQPIKFFNPNNQ